MFTKNERKAEEKIVISGISGVYPNCENISELANKLFAKEDLVTDLPDVNFSVGKLKCVTKFDAHFFGITNEHAEYMDPLCRILLEKTYEAISDAGYNFQNFKDTNTAVFVANCTSDAEMESTFRTDVKGAIICERAQSFLANRISYWLGTHGPSCTVNTACSSSLYALDLAYKAICSGESEAAIVGASNLCLSPGMVRLYSKLGITSDRCRSFDDKAVGFCRSEAISVILVQKAKNARRIYAEVVHIKTNNDGYKKQSILFPSHQVQAKLINEVFQECNVPKAQISWVEAHGTGTRVGDYQEMLSLETLCEERTSPLLVGCVKSNLGHTEATSGLCSIAKIIIAMETGLIPPNLHYYTPQNGIEVLQQDKIRIITETTPWSGEYVAVNNFGIGGANAHLLLRSNMKKSDKKTLDETLMLVAVSGRTEESVNIMLTYLQSTPLNVEFIGLLHKVFSMYVPNHDFRGYTIINKNYAMKKIRETKNLKRSIWFIYPGMGSQWTSMGKELLKFYSFKKSIVECHIILESHGLNLIKILTDDDIYLLENILNCFVGITAIMIALTDMLLLCGIQPDGFIGHSLGEILCAYADRCLNKEEALLTAYYRGVVSLETWTLKGQMAVIGLAGDIMKENLPSSIEVVCYNSNKSCTIAGPVDAVKELIQKLKSENIFVKEIYSAGIAYHSSYIQNMGSIYGKHLEKIIHVSKKRSEKWISSTVHENQCNINSTQYCSPNYFVNNFTKPVQFQRCLKYIPNNAITIEIAPHSILKSVLNHSLSETILNISLMNKYQPKILQHLLTSLGTLYNNGINMDLSYLYSPVTFPVSKGTPMISPLIKWNHNKNWYIPFEKFNFMSPGMKKDHSIIVDIEKEEFFYLQDCVIDGKIIFPESGYLKMVWETFADKCNSRYLNSSVILKDVKFHKSVEISQSGTLEFNIVITRKSGYFEITKEEEVVVEGYIDNLYDTQDFKKEIQEIDDNKLILKTTDIYKDFRISGYNYMNYFQTIICSNIEGTAGKIKWTKNWVLFLDGLMQFSCMQTNDIQHLRIISEIDEIKIDIRKHNEIINIQEKAIPVQVSNCSYRYVECGGVKIKCLKTKYLKRKETKEPTLQFFEFTPYFNEKIELKENVVRMLTTIILENNSTSKINIIEFTQTEEFQILSTEFDRYFNLLPFFKVNVILNLGKIEFNTTTVPSHFKTEKDFNRSYKNIHFVILPSITENFMEILKAVFETQTENCFILVRNKLNHEHSFDKIPGLQICAKYHLDDEIFTLWHKVLKCKMFRTINITVDSFEWIENLKLLIKENNSKIIIYSENYYSGIIGFYKCIRKELNAHILRCFLVLDKNAPSFCVQNKFYEEQLRLNLAINVYKNGKWGCYIPFQLHTVPNILSTRFRMAIEERDENTNLYWTQMIDNDFSQIEQNKLINVYYASLTQDYVEKLINSSEKDLLQNYFYMYEFSGKDEANRNIMGISYKGIISNTLHKKDCLYWHIPDGLTLKDAVIMPLAYITAVFVLSVNDENLRTGNILMVQNGYSHYGLAIIVAALYYGYTVITIEENKKQSSYIKTNFPNVETSFSLDEDNIAEKLRVETFGKTIEILILNEVKYYSQKLLTSITNNGKIIYTGSSNTDIIKIFENALQKGLNVQSIKLENIIKNSNNLTLQNLRSELQKIIDDGYVKSFTLDVFKICTLETLKTYVKSQHKTILQIQSEETITTNIRSYADVKPRLTCSARSSYIICGGLGGMGFELANWLVSRGAKNLFLVSRTGNCDAYKMKKIAKMRKAGVTVIISTEDITTPEGVLNLLKAANEIGYVLAIFNTTLVLNDGAFENQTKESFENVVKPKAIATILLDEISRKICPHLQHFVVFSSITCGYGNAGQTNYGFANSVMERICEMRQSENFPAVAIEWAGVADVGYLNTADIQYVPGGTELQPIRSCLNMLDRFLCQNKTIVSSFIVAENRKIQVSSRSMFKTVQKIIDKSEFQLTSETTLQDIGLDSIALAETKNILEQQYNIFMSAKEIFSLRVEDLWKIESGQQNQRNADRVKNKSIKKLSILEELYNNLFKIVLKEMDILQLKTILRLPSFLQNGAIIEAPVTKEKTIFFLPSVEGLGQIMQPLAKNIDLQVLCAQYDFRATNIEQITRILLPEIEKRLVVSEPFHILGYSYGGLLAMEIAHALEKKGRVGYLYIIDSSPRIVKWISNNFYKDEGYITNTMAFIRALHPPINITEFETGLRQQKDWKSANKYINELLPNELLCKKEYVNIILNTLHDRNNDIELYDGIPKKSLISKVFFFRPKESICQIPSQHDLSEFCSLPIKEFAVDGNHFTILKSEKLAYYIMNLYKHN